MIKITPFGGSSYIGASAYLISDEYSKVLLDAGIQLFPRRTGRFSEGPDEVDFIVGEIDAVILSHAHVDHSGYIPALFRAGYEGKVFMTTPTQSLVEILWKDHIKIEGPHHYSIPHLQQAIKSISTHKYNEKFKVSDGIFAKFTDACHVLGSAGILLDWDGEKIFYTGDYNDAKTPIHDPVSFPDPDDPIDYLITESTNADKTLESRKVISSEMIRSIRRSYSNGSKILIPSFSLGRSQEIQIFLSQELDSFLEKFPVYVDGMIVQMNRVYEKFMTEDWVSPRLLLWMKEKGFRTPFSHDGLIEVNELFGRQTNREKVRKSLARGEGGRIILSTSGMMEGGPIFDYLRFAGSNSKNKLMVVGYQVNGTVGSDIASGAREIRITDSYQNFHDIKLMLNIERYGFSGHASSAGLIDFVRHANPKNTILVHGSNESQRIFSQKLSNEGFLTSKPQDNEEYVITSS